MSPKNDYIHAFLTDLRHHKQVAQRLRHLAQQHPDLVLEYIDQLPANWEISLDTGTVGVLKDLEYLAMKAKRKS